VFPADYPYSSGNSRGLHDNFEDLAKQAIDWADLNVEDLVVDIGANDGTLLRKFNGWGTRFYRSIGVEPTVQEKKITGLSYQEFFSEDVARRIRDEHGPAKVITACNVLAHVDDIHDVMRGINHLLADDGILIAENHDLASVVTGCQWDTVYHEHLRYYDPWTFDTLLRMHGLASWEWLPIPTHGGSFRTVAQRRQEGMEAPPQREYDFDRLQRRAQGTRAALRNDMSGRVFGIGATARATTIINYCGLDVEDIECVCEVRGSDKIGHYIPGTRIPVVDEADLFDQQPARALLFSWHLADHIVPKLRDAGYDGTFIVPLPRMEHRYPGSWMSKSPTGRFG